MTTMILQVPNSQVSWFEQMVRTMGWNFSKGDTRTEEVPNERVFETYVDELLNMFKTDQISQEDVDRECELVKEELYDTRASL
ncbi:MAG: hypothetical protein IJT97_04285 [Bacteroidaceae bacterium]|nr:hypothetical protein [Bacteroidaceae bacterium]